MKFQEAVELLVNDERAEYMYREIWALYSDKCLVYDKNKEQIAFKNSSSCSLSIELVLAKDWVVKFIDDKSSVTVQLENTIQSMIDKIEKIYEGCSFEAFVPGPGDYYPPKCKCDKCISLGRSYRYESTISYFDQNAFEHIKDLLIKGSTSMRSTTWGYEFKATGVFVSIYERSSMVSVLSNNKKAFISDRLFFSHDDKKFYSKLRDPAPPRD